MPKPLERLAPLRSAGRTKIGIGELESAYLGVDNRGIIDGVGAPKTTDRFLERGDAQARKFRHCRQVDVQGIEKQAAAREVRTRLRRSVIEQIVQRIEPDTGGAEIGRQIDERE